MHETSDQAAKVVGGVRIASLPLRDCSGGRGRGAELPEPVLEQPRCLPGEAVEQLLAVRKAGHAPTGERRPPCSSAVASPTAGAWQSKASGLPDVSRRVRSAPGDRKRTSLNFTHTDIFRIP